MLKYIPIFITFASIATFMVFDEAIKPLDDQEEIELQYIEIEQVGGLGYGEEGGEDEDSVSV